MKLVGRIIKCFNWSLSLQMLTKTLKKLRTNPKFSSNTVIRKLESYHLKTNSFRKTQSNLKKRYRVWEAILRMLLMHSWRKRLLTVLRLRSLRTNLKTIKLLKTLAPNSKKNTKLRNRHWLKTMREMFSTWKALLMIKLPRSNSLRTLQKNYRKKFRL